MIDCCFLSAVFVSHRLQRTASCDAYWPRLSKSTGLYSPAPRTEALSVDGRRLSVCPVPNPPRILSEYNSEKNENCSTVAEVIVKIKLAYFFETRCIRKIRDVILSFCMKFTTKIALTVVDHFHPGDVRFFVVNVADFVHQPNAKPNV